MAIAHDASTAGGSATTNGTAAAVNKTFSHTVGSGSNRLLVVYVGIETSSAAAPPLSTVTYNGTSLTHACSVITTESANSVAELWYLLEASMPAAGTYTVSVTSTISHGQLIVAATSVTGVKQTTPTTATAQTGTDGTTFSSNITTTADGSWVFDVIASNNQATTGWTANAGQVERADQNAAGNNSSSAASTKEVATAGSTTMGWTSSTSMSRFAHSKAAWEPAAISQAITAAATLPGLTGSGTLAPSNPLGATATLPALTGAAVLAPSDPITGAATLPALTGVATLAPATALTSAATLPALTAAAVLGRIPAPRGVVTLEDTAARGTITVAGTTSRGRITIHDAAARGTITVE